MATFKYEARFSDGTVATRGSDRTYTHAALRQSDHNRELGNEPWVTFHGSEAAARKDARWLVEVVPVIDLKRVADVTE